MKQKSKTNQVAWIGGITVIIAAILTGLFGLFHKNGGSEKIQNVNITGRDSSSISVTNNQNAIKGDYINGNKVIINRDTLQGNKNVKITAPKALIVTNNQSGGNNSVNINQITSQTYQKISKEISDQLNKNLNIIKIKYPNNPKVIIEIESGNSMRDRIARDLESFFASRNLGYYPKGNTSIGRFPDHPISIFTSSKNLNFSIA